jgi:hypothetical protein
MLGKGSGKDFLISGFMAYMAYLLCCLYDPHKFFSFGQDEPIDLINVATNANQANAVFFKKLKARLRNCGWFKEVRHRQPEAYKDRLPVDLVNVANTLEFICQQVFVQRAMFDKFNSAEVAQRLMDCGVDAEDKAFSNPFQVQIYQNGKSVIYSGNIELLGYKPRDSDIASPNEELRAIKLMNGNKIDHDNKVGDKKAGKDYSVINLEVR